MFNVVTFLDREDRYLMRQRGAGTHKIKDADFGLAFPIPSKPQHAPRLSTASIRSTRSSLPGQSSRSLLGSNHGPPEGTLRRQRSDSAVGGRRESSAIPQGSTGKRGRPPGSSALRRSTTAQEESTRQVTPLRNVFENEAKESEDEEEIPHSVVAARTPTLRLVLKRKRDSSPPADDGRMSISRRRSLQQPGSTSMVDELEVGSSPGLFVTPGNERPRQSSQLPSRSSRIPDSRIGSARDREPFHTPTGQIIRRPGSLRTVRAVNAHDDEPDDDDLHDSTRSENAPQDILGMAQAEDDEEVDELAGEAPAAEDVTHEETTAPPPTVPARQPMQRPEQPKRKPAHNRGTQARSAPASLRQQAARNIRRSKGAQVLVYRLANDASSNNPNNNEAEGEEEGEDILSTAPKFIRRPGVNAVDVLNQLCKELIETHLETLHERGVDEADPQRRSELRHHRRAIEGFGKELEERCFELTEALDTNHALHIRARQASREKFRLREALLRLRRERETVGLKIDGVKRVMEHESQKARHENSIHTSMHDIEIAVQRGRARQQKQQKQHQGTSSHLEKNTGMAGLEIQLSRMRFFGGVEDEEVEDGGGAGADEGRGKLLGLTQIKEFNAFLERALGVLDGEGGGAGVRDGGRG
ncbi:MAG: hypothetical protein M1816_001836 [Peltula sp. TS41687]|nr:MAG: hypothetical protein M1816_001836 [Peltula sp. TS41687]